MGAWYKLRKNVLVKLSFVYWERDGKYMRSIEWNIYITTKLKVIKEYTRTVETASHLSYWKKGSVTAGYWFVFLSFINHCYIINYILALKNSLEHYAEAILLYGILYVIGYSVTVLHRSFADEFCTQNYKFYITG